MIARALYAIGWLAVRASEAVRCGVDFGDGLGEFYGKDIAIYT